MSEPLNPDANASLTPFVRQFARIARLAAADPLRRLPPDPLTQLATLGAPVVALLDVAPLERLREAINGPPAAARRGNVARGRLQPLADRDSAGRTIPAALGATGATGHLAPGTPVPAAARQGTSPRARSPLSSAPRAPAREPVSTMTLAERRAALRRVSADPALPSRSTTPEGAHVSRGDAVSTAPSSAGDISSRRERERDDETSHQPRHEGLFVPFVAQMLRQVAQSPSPIEERGTVAGQSDVVEGSAALASVDESPIADTLQSTLPDVRANREASVPSAVGSSRSAAPALSPPLVGARSLADVNAAKRHRDSELTSELELADALFETLYREGVDLSWP